MVAARLRPATVVTAAGALLAAAGTAHAAANLRLLRRPRPAPARVREAVSILVPARDEAARITECLRSILAQEGLDDVEVLVLDDESEDATPDVVASLLAGHAHATLIGGAGAPPEGWLGKPWACSTLAAAASGQVLVFVDADVRLAPRAVAAAVDMLRFHELALVSPYPRIDAESRAERVLQPLLAWSWATMLPLRLAERSARPSLAAAGGQFLLVDADALAAIGGFAAVRGEVLDDLALVRLVKEAGLRGGLADGHDLAWCRMYATRAEVVAGWTKSLWAAFGSGTGGPVAVGALFGWAYLVPPAAAVLGCRPAVRWWGAAGYLAAVAGRALVARRLGARAWPDALAHPLSVGAFLCLLAASVRGHRRGTLRWRGRPVSPLTAGGRPPR